MPLSLTGSSELPLGQRAAEARLLSDAGQAEAAAESAEAAAAWL